MSTLSVNAQHQQQGAHKVPGQRVGLRVHVLVPRAADQLRRAQQLHCACRCAAGVSSTGHAVAAGTGRQQASHTVRAGQCRCAAGVNGPGHAVAARTSSRHAGHTVRAGQCSKWRWPDSPTRPSAAAQSGPALSALRPGPAGGVPGDPRALTQSCMQSKADSCVSEAGPVSAPRACQGGRRRTHRDGQRVKHPCPVFAMRIGGRKALDVRQPPALAAVQRDLAADDFVPPACTRRPSPPVTNQHPMSLQCPRPALRAPWLIRFAHARGLPQARLSAGACTWLNSMSSNSVQQLKQHLQISHSTRPIVNC